MKNLITISSDNTHILNNGKLFFWLADTCWSAFTNISDNEWEDYLNIRASQGFNVLQINTLTQWDRCGSNLNHHPFFTLDKIRYDFSQINKDYFERANKMCRIAVEKGFILALVIMWCNYVPDTWASKIFPDNVIPEKYIKNIVKTICETFNEFSPIYIISGDTDFKNQSTIKRYSLITDLVEKYSPNTLKAYHICGRSYDLPQIFANRANLYLYQSGHNSAGQDFAYKLAEHFSSCEPKLPVINSEPCYEQMGYSHKEYGRFRRFETRRALWYSLLSGAKAGITYGAHGVWNWQKEGMPPNKLIRNSNEQPISFGEGFLRAMPYNIALKFSGVQDYVFAKKLFEKYNITSLIPCQEILIHYKNEIRASYFGNIIIIYIPVNAPIELYGDWSNYTATAIDLTNTKNKTIVKLHKSGSKTTIDLHPFYEDALLFLSPN